METSGDFFMNGNRESVSSLLANLTTRLQNAQDEITTIKTEMQRLLSEETDPKISTVTQDKWCVGASGGQVECTADAPLLSYTETDPKISTVTQDKWCVGASGGQVECSQDPPAMNPPKCLAPHILSFNGSLYACFCADGYSGLSCEVGPSLNGYDLETDSKIHGILSISSSGERYDDPRYDAGKSLDGDITSRWIASSSSNAFLVFDLKFSYYISGFSIRTKDNNNSPKSCEVQFGTTANGPWLTAKAFELFGPSVATSAGDVWHFFSLPISTKTRFIQLYIDDNHGGQNVEVYEVEFFTPNVGVRLRPARGVLLGYCEVNGSNKCTTADAPAICQVNRNCACSAGYNLRRLSFPIDTRGYNNRAIYVSAAYACTVA